MSSSRNNSKSKFYTMIYPAMGILVLRAFIGLRLLYGVVDNIFSWDRMVEFSGFLASHDFPFPIVCAVTSVYVQFIGSIMILVGYKTRFASLLIVINFIVALAFVHLSSNDSIEGMTAPMAMLFGSLTILLTGAEKYSIDYYLASIVRKNESQE